MITPPIATPRNRVAPLCHEALWSVGALVVFGLAAFGAWSLATYQSPPTIAPDVETITVRATPSRARKPVVKPKPIPCVTTAPYTGTPCP